MRMSVEFAGEGCWAENDCPFIALSASLGKVLTTKEIVVGVLNLGCIDGVFSDKELALVEELLKSMPCPAVCQSIDELARPARTR